MGLQQPPRTVDRGQVRVSFVVYGVLYVVMEMIGHQLELIGWARLSALDVATAVTDAFLTVAICGAVLLALELGAQRWLRARQAREDAGPPDVEWDDGPIEVTSWRPTPLALPAGSAAVPVPAPGGYAAPLSPGRPFPEEPGRLL